MTAWMDPEGLCVVVEAVVADCVVVEIGSGFALCACGCRGVVSDSESVSMSSNSE